MSPLFARKSLLLVPALLFAAGCGGGLPGRTANPGLTLTPGTAAIDTNCTGCNANSGSGVAAEQFHATLTNGEAADVRWSVTGGDAAGAGAINADGQYTPPSYLLHDRVQVVVTAALESDPSVTAATVLTLTPGFSAPLTPQNVALGANGSVTISGVVAEAGGSAEIHFALANTASGETRFHSNVEGTLSAPTCQRGTQAFTTCSVTYTAPSAIESTGASYVIATVGNAEVKASETRPSRVTSEILLNSEGLTSNPATHQSEQASPIVLGSSGGNSSDYDTAGGTVADCCGGTLGALLKGSDNNYYLLSNNHVLAHSDQASLGDAIVQPGLIDNNCNPYGPGTTTVASLAGWLPLSSRSTNADAAIARIAPGAVDSSGAIFELGAKQSDGTLAAAPPGISSTGGKGESASLGLQVAKSGRTTGLTCAAVAAIDLDISVDYFEDCAETKPYLTKTFTNQIAISGNGFSDAGDSGSLIVDTANAEPVGLFFAGGTDGAGVSHGIANPAPDLLSELDKQFGGTTYTFQGTADHGVSCLSYGDSTVSAAQARSLADAEFQRGQLAFSIARGLVNPAVGILGVGLGKSNDHPGTSAIIIYTDEKMTVPVPASVDGVRTLAIATNARAVALGSAPQTPGWESLPAATLKQAEEIKQQAAHMLMKENPGFFGVGVGQSLDNPKEAALVIYVDRGRIPAQLPQNIDGLRTRYILMDRLHVTRSYATPAQSSSHCLTFPAENGSSVENIIKPLELKLD